MSELESHVRHKAVNPETGELKPNKTEKKNTVQNDHLGQVLQAEQRCVSHHCASTHLPSGGRGWGLSPLASSPQLATRQN